MSYEIYTTKMIDFIKQKIATKMKIKYIHELVIEHFNYRGGIGAFYRFIKRNIRDTENVEINVNKNLEEDKQRDEVKFLELIKKKEIYDIYELCDLIGCSPKRIKDIVEFYRSKGYEIVLDEYKLFLSSEVVSNVKKIDTLEDKEIVFGVASDLHFGSKSVQITALNKFCEICRKKDVKYIFCPGDVVAGYNVYPGQVFDVHAISAEEQESSVIVNLPTGFEWLVLGGNHDYSFIKKGGGHNPLLAIASQREDFHYVGFDEADVPILKNVDLKMWHPSGGVPYSVSYRLQKGIEQIAYSELTSIVRNVKDRPTVRFVLSGHLHIQMQALFGSIFGCQCGTFEGQTNYLKRKGLIPHVGGYIIKASLGRNGLLRNFDAKFYLFEEIEDDWKNYNHEIKYDKIEKPLFG